jgi:manganese transport protein
VVIALGVNATDALVYSQVILSFALPVPMIALIVFTSRRDIMGEFVNSRLTRYAALAGTAVVLVLNTVLILQTFGIVIPGLPAA